jgi:glycosyltransferase involved in cell wall biosynthesis
MTTKAHVVHIITRLDLGGAQENTLYCVRHHDRAKYDVSLIAGAGGVLDGEARAIPQTHVHIVPWMVHDIDPLADLAAITRMARLFESIRPDLVHTHSGKASLIARLAAQLAKVPVVVYTAHGWSFNEAQRPLVQSAFVALERVLAGLTDKMYTVSEIDKRRGDTLGIAARTPTRVLHSGVDVAHFEAGRALRAASRAALGVDDDEVLVGTIACLKPQKAPLDLVETAARAIEDEPRLRFVVAGDGFLRREVEARIKRHGLDDRFRLLGWRRDTDRLFAALDVFLLMSRYEGLPRVVLESFAASVPVVATAVDGIPEVVENGVTGLLVSPGDIASAARALVELARAPERRRALATSARARLSGDLDIGRMLLQLECDFDALLSRSRDGASRIR